MAKSNQWRKNTGHLESADPVVWAQSRACAIKLQDWYQHDFLPIQLKQLTSLARKMADDNITLPFYIIFIPWLNVILPTSLYIYGTSHQHVYWGGGMGKIHMYGWTKTNFSLVSKNNRNNPETDPVSVIFGLNWNYFFSRFLGTLYVAIHFLKGLPLTIVRQL